MKRILKPEFFNRNSVLVARDLIGKYLTRKTRDKIMSFMIVETEAYEGLKDKASHSHRGQTPRNTPMWEEPATIYVYFTYGMHWMLNISCGKKGHPAAVLLRGIEGCIGPGRLTKKLSIDKTLNGKILGKEAGLWIEEDLTEIKKIKVLKTPRIGINSAGPIWTKKLYRFVLK
ncbi:DNA-3-methyladenine glycosylase [Patescibacteria group bacterium]|nr:DNA-3-methyladenine glycosylase [Patescibacteria group bacterium]